MESCLWEKEAGFSLLRKHEINGKITRMSGQSSAKGDRHECPVK